MPRGCPVGDMRLYPPLGIPAHCFFPTLDLRFVPLVETLTFFSSPRPGIYLYQHFLLFHSCQSLTPRRQGLVETGKIILAPFLHALTRCALFRRGKGMLWTVWFTSLVWHIEGSSCLSWNIWDSRDQVSRRHQGKGGITYVFRPAFINGPLLWNTYTITTTTTATTTHPSGHPTAQPSDSITSIS
ncbi:hypothetical protein P168DRAFT_12018 [Aspergillus campestris IBT 28561]|uniref:Uncharacterized protein n=1 Tax=Aspergillus campestris (strain IBT 28561) TaxID=1392248 RepID=A0A2I1DEC1_ASPC2|nr:uncharacterized protein P168DRAFT_12018 [Aspergillus campestris IBT 28561]PKY08228.1 hypothetical protein P168DRAFT_12018 [Aspergillus campestris IBT 28561]